MAGTMEGHQCMIQSSSQESGGVQIGCLRQTVVGRMVNRKLGPAESWAGRKLGQPVLALARVSHCSPHKQQQGKPL